MYLEQKKYINIALKFNNIYFKYYFKSLYINKLYTLEKFPYHLTTKGKS